MNETRFTIIKNVSRVWKNTIGAAIGRFLPKKKTVINRKKVKKTNKKIPAVFSEVLIGESFREYCRN